LDVIKGIGEDVSFIFTVDDCCPDNSGAYIQVHCDDSRVKVLMTSENLGVGGAVLLGYQAAIEAGSGVIVKLDGDGQMDPSLIPKIIAPILVGEADYCKGNRFFDLEKIRAMPNIRIFGNAVLSFMTKVSSGYWDLFDPTNGYTAIHADVARRLPIEKISSRYFFETDILFRLNTLRAVVVDVPMDARYGDEISHLKISRVVGEFFVKHIRNFFKRIFYNYYLRDMSVASLELPLGGGLLTLGSLFGVYHWIGSFQEGTVTPAGTVMLAALPILMGVQLILAFINYDIANVPQRPLQDISKPYKLYSIQKDRINGK